jgi:tetratricopeptide (TPR) repeat protein
MCRFPAPTSTAPATFGAWALRRLAGTLRAAGEAWQLGVVCLLAAAMAACAARTPPALPSVLKYPEFVFPAAPPTLQTSPAAPAVTRGWAYLQSDDEASAEREFAAALRRDRAFYPARAGEGYVALARRDFDKAVTEFDAALTSNRDYVPALVGRGQALLALQRDADALAAFERALALDASLTGLSSRIQVLRFRNVQDVIERARTAARANRLDEARREYERALTASPDSAFLYRELGAIERRQGDAARALDHLRRAIELDPTDTAALIDAGQILEERQAFDAALANYRRAAEIEPGPAAAARIAAATARAREARLPAEFKAIAQAPQVTRGDLAALIGIRLEPLLQAAAPRQEVVTDIRTHWAARWIAAVVNAGVMDAFENHTFQPLVQVRRADLATAASRAVQLIAQRRADVRQRIAERPRIADVPPGHLDYPAVSAAVASGVMPLVDGRFQVSRPVTGAEAIETITRLQALADIR